MQGKGRVSYIDTDIAMSTHQRVRATTALLVGQMNWSWKNGELVSFRLSSLIHGF
jgi:hypothetical protein